jgi:hypothetical protein
VPADTGNNDKLGSDVHISRSVVFLCGLWRWGSADKAFAVPNDGTPFRTDDFRFCGYKEPDAKDGMF